MARKQKAVVQAEEPKQQETVQEKKSVKAQKRQSNLALGRELFARKATDKEVIAAFTKAYAAAGVTDAEFIARRAAIYLRIAKKSA